MNTFRSVVVVKGELIIASNYCYVPQVICRWQTYTQSLSFLSMFLGVVPDPLIVYGNPQRFPYVSI